MTILRVSKAVGAMAAGLVFASAAAAAGQDVSNSRAMPGNETPAGPHVLSWGQVSPIAPAGKPDNHWRYRLYNGRWWYWASDDSWSFFNGDTWVPYTPESAVVLRGAPTLGPIAGSLGQQGVFVHGKHAGLTAIAGDHPAAPSLKRGTVLPKYLKQQTLPKGEKEPGPAPSGVE
jgi:hypothetical protein